MDFTRPNDFEEIVNLSAADFLALAKTEDLQSALDPAGQRDDQLAAELICEATAVGPRVGRERRIERARRRQAGVEATLDSG